MNLSKRRPPSYLSLHRTGRLSRRIEKARSLLRKCTLCPWRCGVDRLAGERGFCRIGATARVASYAPHFGEEPPLVGSRGSGTIFLAGCNLRCVYCQNFDISQLDEGEDVSPEELAEMMISLQRQGCHNINFVTPTHVVPQILEALSHAADEGLVIPLVYNCGGYESEETLILLEGIFDIYLPDIKYADETIAEELSGPKDYAAAARRGVREMYRQVGNLETDGDGIAARGLMVRHLVLPGNLSGVGEVLAFIARELSPETYVNLMDQYHPCFKTRDHPSLGRRVTREEMMAAYSAAKALGLRIPAA
jgi:putative pyruvate formate lyase activating enzyme